MTRTRRDALKLGAVAGAAGAAAALGLPWRALRAQGQQPAGLIERKIPHTGDRIPIIGIGTARRYDVGASEAALAPLRQVLRNFTRMGGSVIDTAPTYGRAEEVVGRLIQQIGNRDRVFIATKISLRGRSGRQAGIEQMEQSMRRFGTDHIELMQVHNLGDWQTQLPLIREWKAAGKLGNIGITTSFDGQYEEMERIMRTQEMDMIQVDYAINNRNAERRILPLAADRGFGVLINLPFGRKSTFAAVHGTPLPSWAADYDIHSWAQYFLKWIVSHPAVTAAIPGTATMSYLVDNLAAARGRLPDAAGRRRMLEYFQSL
jgi:aryl-alcohol dehydrogenase-like predicted oxidoreductase